MRRALVPLALVLALLTGAALDATRLVVLAPAVALDAEPSAGADAAVVRRFYAAVNTALATGDSGELASLLAPEFVDDAPRPGATPDRAGLLGSVAALHAVAPSLSLTVLDVTAQGDRVAVRVGTAGGAGAAFLGLPLAADRLWGAFEAYRVAGGQVTARWGDPTGLAAFAPLAAVAVPVDRMTRKAVTLERWTYAPGAAETRVTDGGFVVLLVDAGRLTVRLEGAAPGAEMVAGGNLAMAGKGLVPGTDQALDRGDALAIPYGWRFAVANEGQAPAAALVVVADIPGTVTGAAAWASLAPTGVAHAVLAFGPAPSLPAGTATVRVGRAALAPGAALPAPRVGVVELAAVEEGALALTADGGDAWVVALPNAMARRADGETVPAGGGVLVEAGTAASYRPAGNGPLALLLVTIAPTTGAATAPADAAAPAGTAASPVGTD
jgi:mannose-6-phosphate isomerase-like protein (cupin superfamily)